MRRFWWLSILLMILVVFAFVAIHGVMHNAELVRTSGLSGGLNVYESSHFYKDDTTAKFTALPCPLDIISAINPLGGAGSANPHSIPSNHVTVQTKGKGDGHVFPVYAVADGYIVQVNYQPASEPALDGTPKQLDGFALTLQVSKDLFIMQNHLNSLAPDLAAKIGSLQPGNQNFPNVFVNSGSLLGQGGGSPALASTDLWAIDLTRPAPFIHPDWYGAQDAYSVNALDYFVEPLKSELYDKLPARPEPRAGQFAYDIDGKLVGNWISLQHSQEGATLSFFYYSFDPSLVYIGYAPIQMVYVVKGNVPDPATISVASGLVKFELMNSSSYFGQDNPGSFHVEATMLVQMLADRHIKMEIFEGKTANEVNGFDANALEFIR